MSTAPASRAAFRPLGLSWPGLLSLVAVIAVLIVVSVPRLRGLALRENEVDARATALFLGGELRAVGRGSETPLARVLRRAAGNGNLADAELLANGSLVRRHGYLFSVVPLPWTLSLACLPLDLWTGTPSPSGRAVLAWPWRHGATGEAAFLVTEGGVVYLHPNTGASWDGLSTAGAPQELRGWRRLP